MENNGIPTSPDVFTLVLASQLYESSASLLGKRKRDDKEPELDGYIEEPKKDPLDQEGSYNTLIDKIGKFKLDGITGSLPKFRKLRKLEQKMSKFHEIFASLHSRHKEIAEKEAEEEWNRRGKDPKAWDEVIFGNERDSNAAMEKIAGQFELMMKDPELKKKHIDQLEIIYELFHQRSKKTTIAPKTLRLMNKWASHFNDEVILLVEGKEYRISQNSLFSSQSTFFRGLIEFSVPDDGPIELTIDDENFQLLYHWLLFPNSDLFKNIEFDKLLTFLEVICKYNIPRIEKHCKASLSRQITSENVFLILDKLFLFNKRNLENGTPVNFPGLEKLIIQFLSTTHCIMLSSRSNNENWLLNPDELIELNFTETMRVVDFLTNINKCSFFKSARIKLNMKNFKIFSQQAQKLMICCFPNMEEISLKFEVARTKKSNGSKINWSFLTQFKNLKKINVVLPNQVTDVMLAIFLSKFPTKDEWIMSFDLKSHQPLENARGPYTISTDNFIEFYSRESRKTTHIPKQFRPFIRDHHLQKLMDAKTFDLESPRLNLRGLYHTTDQFMGDIVLKMKNLEELQLDFYNSSLYIFDILFPQFASRLKKLSLTLGYFQAAENLDPLNHFIQEGQCKDLIIYIDQYSLTNNLMIPPQTIKLLKNNPSLRLEIKSCEKTSLIFLKDTYKIKVKKGANLHQISTCRSLNSFAGLIKHFPQTPLIIDLTEGEKELINEYLIGLSLKFPEAQELQYPVFDDIDLKFFNKFNWLKRLTFAFFQHSDNQEWSWNEIIDFFKKQNRILEKLQNYPADVVIKRVGHHHPPLEEFIHKMEELGNLLPNFQALKSLPSEHHISITDEQLLRLIPKKCHTVLDVTSMPFITAKGLLEAVKKFPEAKFIWDENESLTQTIQEEKLSLDECIPLIAALQNYQIPFFTNPEFGNLRPQLTDPHLLKLLDANRISPLTSLDLSHMSSIQKPTFLRLVNTVKPQKLTLNQTPNLYPALYSIAAGVQTLTLPFEAIKEPSFSEFFFVNFLKESSNKKLIIHCEPSDLEWLNEEMIIKLNHPHMITHFLSPQMEIVLKLKKVHIKLLDATFNSTFSKDSPFLQSLERLTIEAAPKGKIEFNYTTNGDECLPLNALMNHCTHFKELQLVLKSTRKLLNKKRNFQVLKKCKNITKLTLHCDDDILPICPALDIFKELRCPLKIFVPEFYNITNMEDFLKKAKALESFFPSHPPLEIVALSPVLLAQFTDEIIPLFKPKVERDCLDFRGMSQISYLGVARYIDGLNFKSLKFYGCQRLIEEGTLSVLQCVYPNVKITPLQSPMDLEEGKM